MMMNQIEDVFGKNALDPFQQQPKWMDKPVGDPSGLVYLRSLDFLLVEQVISLSESIE